ncbi:metalloregulator ArsR/SmtB family transcription factor [Bradyrhizobium genosp. P]|uniref:metalloregulator ArsR/SmtB family transcription factor n=1 Tax=Bradyrhizobium genosp. P TaxID=83641 RepID=UPI003CE892F4
MKPDLFTTDDAVEMFASLAQPTRLEAFRLLARYLPYGLPAGDVARLLAVPHNTMSTHLSQLERAGLLTSRREGRSIIYAAKSGKIGSLFDVMLGEMQSSGDDEAFPQRRPAAESSKGYNVLVLCSGNSARSIIAESILNREGAGRFRAYSAGSRPQERPHRLAVELLDSLGYETGHLRSKSWNEFAGKRATVMDFVVTVCDAAAGEECPFWPGHPLQAHWGIPDPAVVKGTKDVQRAAFLATYRRLTARLTALVNLPVEKLDLASLKRELASIGRMEGATEATLSAPQAA